MANKERKITLEAIDPMDIYGVNNRILDRIKRYFPKMKIVAREWLNGEPWSLIWIET